MIDKIRLKSCPTPQNGEKLEFEVTPITIFVGPNNSGKSRALIEIENFCRKSYTQSNDIILDDLIFTPFTHEEIAAEINQIKVEQNPDENVQPGLIILSKLNPQIYGPSLSGRKFSFCFRR